MFLNTYFNECIIINFRALVLTKWFLCCSIINLMAMIMVTYRCTFLIWIPTEKHVIPNNSNVLTETPGRKRPLLSGECNKVSMTPSKRTVMAILARARTAQVHVKDMVTFSPHFNG